ncbi:PhnD/SsuA/transferrin family substrate-binding protein [Haloarchaeobius baliensis]|uniref:PhnD/SsuA/transferrin family substrate-binding protein n=1 Tax=Haloarchaeobius baliensis TaxID=1670458 RepID=UPI003F8804E7
MESRRNFLKAAGAATTAGMVGTAGCIGSFGGDPYVDGTLTFLMSPTEPQDQMRDQYSPIGERLVSHIDPISEDDLEMRYAANYGATLEGLNSGTADVAETGPFAAALGVNSGKVDLILQRYAYGGWEYSSFIVAPQGSDITEPADLEGKDVAFADPLSASGSLYPLAMIKEDTDLSLPDEPGSPEGADFNPQWSTHIEASNAAANEQVDAAGVGDFAYFANEDKLQVVAERSGIPRAPIVASPELSDSEKEKIITAFTEAPDTMYYGADGTEGNDDDVWFDDVRRTDIDTYQPVIDTAENLGYGEEIFG